MRTLMLPVVILALSACASQAPAPEKSAVAPAAKPGPQCYSSDDGRFFNSEEQATIAGVAVTCKPTADGKSGQWVGSKR